MKVFASAALLVAGTVLLTFTAMSFGLFPRQLSSDNPTLLLEALAVAGAVFFAIGARGLHRIQRELGGRAPVAPGSTAAT